MKAKPLSAIRWQIRKAITHLYRNATSTRVQQASERPQTPTEAIHVAKIRRSTTPSILTISAARHNPYFLILLFCRPTSAPSYDIQNRTCSLQCKAQLLGASTITFAFSLLLNDIILFECVK
jgi:hypothetical protein